MEIVVDDELEASFTPPDMISEAVMMSCQVAGYSDRQPELCVRFATDAAVHELNAKWRDRDQVTDVLSFPMQEGPDFDFQESLGDIALALPFVLSEASRLNLAERDHMLHLIIHATLHLLGYDHIEDDDAEKMQQLEREAMQRLHLHDPYPLIAKESPEIL